MASAEIAELREFISGELQKVHTRFDGVDGRFDQVDGRLDQVEGGLAEVRKRVDQVQVEQQDFQEHVARHFGEVYARLSRVETQFEEMRSDFRAFGEELGSANRRTEELRSDMNRGFSELREEMRAGFRSWGDRVVALEDRREGRGAKRG